MTSSKTSWKRLRVRWTAPKGFAAILLFSLLALLFEYLMVVSFQLFGLTDPNTWIGALVIPGVNWSLTIAVSPLLHLLPLAVVVVLLSSWAYLTKYTALVPSGRGTARKVPSATRRRQGKTRFRALGRLSKRLSRRLQRIGQALKGGAQRIRGVSYISMRLSFAGAAVRSALTVLAVFVSLFIILFIVAHPWLTHKWVIELYRGNPSLLTTVQGLGQALAPIGDSLSAINNAVIGLAPNFKKAMEGLGATVTQPIVRMDVVGKYVFVQNLTAWVSAVISLAYGSYSSSRRRYRHSRTR